MKKFLLSLFILFSFISVSASTGTNVSNIKIENIDVETKSETRKMIEKFVDENPELAAALLRNWLNEDWN